ncbi:MAG: UDP-glucose 4-epimerase GalE [Psychroflexus sp.]|nr:UDP-glucose 4-epimerase GalE [Psychroflexus sp.]MDR9449388.1 UDP-glucose 4-epimerase GalE [Psychroflexus sp.]
MKILVTGGLGFIGSHTVVALVQQGHEVVIIDNLSNSSLDVLDRIALIINKKPEFYQVDVRDQQQLRDFFQNHQDIEGCIHFAASKAVGESVEQPLHYYQNNISALINLLKELTEIERCGLIFSSSCTVYGQADELPITENAPVKKAESPYGNTKQIGEEIITDTTKVSDLQAISLRYFNPIGAHETAYIGELPKGTPQNLVPYITQTAIGIIEELSVFGDDYPTDDGTCIRDYIHVVDLAEAHVVAVERLINQKNKTQFEVFNVGTGKGNSVLEVVKAFETSTGVNLPYKIAPRRSGDVVAAYADTTKANQELGWTAKHSLEDALKSAWKWQKNLA